MHSPLRHLPSLIWKHRPIQLTYFVTRRCNARCPYCFYLESEAAAPCGDELSVEELGRVARSLGSLLWLALSGGEIFLRRDLPEVCQTFYEVNRPAIILLPTNGSLPDLIAEGTERIVAQCPESVVAVKLSIDGVGEAHDRLRNTPQSFERTLQTHARLAPLLERYPNLELGVNTVFCAANQDAMDSIIDFVASLPGVGTHTVSLVRGDLRQPDYKAVDLDKYASTAARLAERMQRESSARYRFRGARLKAAQDVLQRQLIRRTVQTGQRQIPCYAGRANLVLGETGEIYPCETLTQSWGNVREHGYDIGSVLRASPARRGSEAIGAGACHCSHECYFMTNIMLNPRLYPALAREWLRLPEATLHR